jgi:hypothetical protein
MHHHGGGRGASAGVALPSLPESSESNADLVKLESPDLHFRRDGSVLQILAEKDPEAKEEAEQTATGAAAPSHDAEATALAGETPAPRDTPASSETPETEAPPEQEWVEVSLVRLFPLTDPDNWISVLSKDGKELGVITELRALSHENLAVVEEELQRRYLVPHVRQILAVKSRYDLMEWTVDTDRGRAVFLTRNAREQLQNTQTRHITITDVEGNRYDIQDVSALDPVSKKRLDEQF